MSVECSYRHAEEEEEEEITLRSSAHIDARFNFGRVFVLKNPLAKSPQTSAPPPHPTAPTAPVPRSSPPSRCAAAISAFLPNAAPQDAGSCTTTTRTHIRAYLSIDLHGDCMYTRGDSACLFSVDRLRVLNTHLRVIENKHANQCQSMTYRQGE
jgi:hypothetical protein